ncbi:MAG: alpha-mannosidase [Ktedonobacterales bacterium]
MDVLLPRLKRTHRQNEARLLTAELLDAWRWSLSPQRAHLAHAALDDAWRTLLLHEFHDILPGSSIGPVYADARRDLGALATTLDAHITESLQAIAEDAQTPSGSLLIFNASPFAASVLLEAPAPNAGRRYTASIAGRRYTLRTQAGDSTSGMVLVEIPELPALGIGTITETDDELPFAAEETPRVDDRTLENAWFAVEFDDHGEIVSCVDKRMLGGRQLVPAGQALNRLQAFEDRPTNFDALDIDATYERAPLPLGDASVEILERGPVRATVRVLRRFRASTIEQRISLYGTTPRIDFTTRIDWHEQHVLLKAAFPLDVRSRTATAEIQYGAVERSTHRNTSWDAARFETVAHRWIDISEASYGVSLLNDGRYGHDAHDNVLRITLLRSPTDPDPEADQGLHEVTYSLYPHLGDWRAGGTVAAAYALNRPPYVVSPPPAGQDVATSQSEHAAFAALLQSGAANVVLEAVKRHESGDGLVVRIYEAHGARCRAEIRAALPLGSVIECDLLERPLQRERGPAYVMWSESAAASHDIPVVEDAAWSFDLRPFEVRTFHVRWG